MNFFYIKNLVSHEVSKILPWNFKPKIPPEITDKESRSKWWQTPTTEHCFYSAFEGQISTMRVSERKNPATKMYGFVVDYDEKITPEMYDAPNFRDTPYLPIAWSKTGSGRGRMVWAFKEPLPLPNRKMTVEFLKIIERELNLKKIWAGFDEAFYRPEQYYEVGHTWKVIDKNIIEPNIIASWMSKAWDVCNKNQKIKVSLDQIYPELERRYPGGWQGPFVIGARTKRFWDKTAENPTSAILRDGGFQCFSGDKAFVSWSELLGQQFVEGLFADKIQAITDGIFFDGRMYWRKNDSGTWLSYSKEDIKLYLRVRMGISGKATSQAEASELDRTLCFIQDTNRIESALPFVHYQPGILVLENKKYLNTCNVQALQPAPDDVEIKPKDFPWLNAFFSNMFSDKEQLPYFFAWLKRFYESGLSYKPTSGQAIFIAGIPDMGKTLLADYIIPKIIGGFRDGSSFLMGESGDFTATYLETPLLTLNDTQVSTDETRHNRYSSMLKKMVANKDFLFNQKYEKAGMVKWCGRIIVTCNVDAEALRVLPNVEMSLLEKIMLFKMSESTRDFSDGFIERINNELPYFCRWLLDWEIPNELKSTVRFGIKSYHHKDLFNVAIQGGNSQSFLEILVIFLENTSDDYRAIWEGTTAKLVSDMQQEETTSMLISKYTIQKVGILLGQLASRGYPIKKEHTRLGSKWVIPYNTKLLTPTQDEVIQEEQSRISSKQSLCSHATGQEESDDSTTLPF